jgi:hypothetical protein
LGKRLEIATDQFETLKLRPAKQLCGVAVVLANVAERECAQ